MRSTFIACALTVAVGTGAQAQLSRTGRSETSQRLSEAVNNRQNEEAKTGALDEKRSALMDTAAKARAELAQPVSPAQAASEAAQQQRLAEALNNISPEGKAMLAQNQAPLLPVPATAGGTARTEPAAAPATQGAPKPKPLKPEPLTEPQPPDTKQTIINGDLTYFDSGQNIAVFVGNVVVDSPQFHITCDEFEVHMRKDATQNTGNASAKGPDGKPLPDKGAKGSSPPAKAADTKGAKGAPAKPDLKTVAATAPSSAGASGAAKPVAPVYSAENPADNSIEKAIAKGRKVVIIKHNPDGKIQIGQSRYAYYDGNTGDITLRESPQVQDGNNLHIATEPTTVMILTQAGALHTTGRARTDLIQADQPGGAQGKGPGAPGTAPAPGKGGISLPGPVPGQ